MMRFLLGIVCALPILLGGAHADERLEDFAWTLPIVVDAREGLHQLELNALVHQGVMRSDLGDVRVVNNAGEPVPHAFAPPPRAVSAAPEVMALPFFPIRTERDARIDALDLKVETRADGTVVGLSTQPKSSAETARHIGYLLDASSVATPLAALRLEWNATANGTHTRVRLEASDDLVRWRALADAAPLVDLQFGGHRLQRRRVAFAVGTAKYLRLSWIPGEEPIVLERAWAEPAAVAAEPKRLWREVAGHPEAGEERVYSYDLGGLFPVDRVRFELPQANTVARVRIEASARGTEPWRSVAEALVYRLTRAGAESTSPEIAFAPVTQRYWRLSVDDRSSGFGNAAPTLHAGWIAPRIVFAARGEPPFRLAFGHRDVQRPGYAIANLVPGYQAGEPLDLANAKLGDPSGADAMPAPLAERPDYRKWSLWAVLLLAVAVLALMAYRLVRQLERRASGPPATGDPERDCRTD